MQTINVKKINNEYPRLVLDPRSYWARAVLLYSVSQTVPDTPPNITIATSNVRRQTHVWAE